MCSRFPNQPQTLFNFDNLNNQPSTRQSKTIFSLHVAENIHQRIYQFIQNVIQLKITIPSLFNQILLEDNIQKISSIQKLNILYQPPKFSSTTSFSDRLSIKLCSQPSQNAFSYITFSQFQENCSFESQKKITLPMLQMLFDTNQQQLILMCIGILLKYVLKSKQVLSHQNAYCMLMVASIIGNKIYYDAQMPTIIKEYSQSFNIQVKQLKSLENKMLKYIQYNFQMQKSMLNKLESYLLN